MLLTPSCTSRRPTTFRLGTVAAACAASLALAACSGGDATSDVTAPSPSASSSSGGDESSPPTTPEATPSETDSTPAEPAASTQTKISHVVKDDVLGNTITFASVVRDFPVPDDFPSLQEDGEIVLVQVDAQAGEKFSGGVQGGWGLTTPDGAPGNSTTIVDTEMAAAGYEPFDPPSRGESSKGWVAFQVNDRADTYTLEYKRSAANVIGSDKTIPAKTWEFPLS